MHHQGDEDMSTDKLKAEAQSLASVYHDFVKQRESTRATLLAEAEERIKRHLDHLDQVIELAHSQARAATLAYEEALVKDARDAGKPWPEGTLVMRPVTHSSRKPTGKTMHGKVEVWNRDSKVMKNRRMAPPDPGDVVIRIVHTDGSEGTSYERVYPWSVSPWTAVDGTPPKLVERPAIKL
jgi:hypothetical protein